MMKFLIVAILFTMLLEYYGWQLVKHSAPVSHYRQVRWGYWLFTLALYLMFFLYRQLLYRFVPHGWSVYFPMLFLLVFVVKLVSVFFLLPEDAVRLARYTVKKVTGQDAQVVSRSRFLSRVAAAVAAIPVVTLMYGMLVNAYNYRFHRVALRFPNLPEAFEGFTIIQISDIHSGSFTQTEPIANVIAQINRIRADLIVFTGDLVNNVASEMESFIPLFSQLRAAHGVYSITGNHDYGDYVGWNSAQEKQMNFERFKNIHKELGWDLLMNEHRILEKDGGRIAILGVENWGTGRWTRYGKLDKAYQGTENIPFKILLTHNPQHWDAQVRPLYPDIDLTLSGHTHGAQMGVEEKWLRWSPAQYVYKQWAGLYREGTQYLYVNRGFGFLFYPGRVGILPEVTVITLHKA
ncbi:MAG: metallophosphoesterase [Chitinophagales bacterium]|nr:metallophosphoesterase [Chitinophagales bacterium]MDW8419385.1 metallophosphoesterase [Chitinophagales bacterium]